MRIIRYRHHGFDGLVHSFVFGIKDTGNVTLELFLLGLHVFYGEGDDSSPNLNGHSVMSLQSKLVFQKDDGAEFGSIVFDVEAVLLTLDDSVASTDRDIIYTHLRLMASSKLEF